MWSTMNMAHWFLYTTTANVLLGRSIFCKMPCLTANHFLSFYCLTFRLVTVCCVSLYCSRFAFGLNWPVAGQACLSWTPLYGAFIVCSLLKQQCRSWLVCGAAIALQLYADLNRQVRVRDKQVRVRQKWTESDCWVEFYKSDTYISCLYHSDCLKLLLNSSWVDGQILQWSVALFPCRCCDMFCWG